MREHFDIERMLRFNGKRPTMRDHWRAFYRLYRLATKADGSYNLNGGAVDCLRVMGYHDWVCLCRADDDMACDDVPVFLRRRFLEASRRKRLYGKRLENYGEFRSVDQAASRRMAEQHGIEVTPDECGAVRAKVLRLARAKAAELDLRVPESDVELLQMLTRHAGSLE